MELVSIIIPLFNKAEFIEETIHCVLGQSWPNIEVFIIENNSTDNSYEVAKRHECRNLTVIRSRKPGASSARNLGLKLAKGRYIQFLDADDLLSRQKIESQVKELSSDFDLAVSNWARFRTSFKSDEKLFREIPKDHLISYEPAAFLETGYMAPVHSWLCPSRLIKRVGLWNETLTVNDDGDYFIRLVNECYRIIYVPELAYYRTDLASSLSQSKGAKACESLYASYETFKRIASSYQSSNLNNMANEKFGNLYLHAYHSHKEVAELCREQMNFNYKYCYSSLSGPSQFIASALGIDSYLRLKKLHQKIRFIKL